jgi:hypothetical protein
VTALARPQDKQRVSRWRPLETALGGHLYLTVRPCNWHVGSRAANDGRIYINAAIDVAVSKPGTASANQARLASADELGNTSGVGRCGSSFAAPRGFMVS